MSPFFRTYRVQDGRRIEGVFKLAFIHNFEYHLTPINIYQDGLIDCWGLVDLAGFAEKVRSGWVVTQPPPGAQISVSFLAAFKAVEASYWIEPEELIKEVADTIEELNGRPTTSSRCVDAWNAYQQSPTPGNKAILKAAYEAIPKHNRRYVLSDMDYKDGPIRQVLNADEGPQEK